MAGVDVNKPTIGFIGLGAMGSRMARRILDAGYPLMVFNRGVEATKSLAAMGAKVGKNPAELASVCGVIFSSVFDEAAVEAVLLGKEGVFSAAKPGLTVVEMSTISPGASKRFHTEAATRSIAYLDAPVSGSTPQAEKGELIVLVGGDPKTYEQCKPILLTMGKGAELLGPGGSGSMAKLCINSLLAIGVQALAEALALGERGGLDRHRLLEVIGQTPVVSPSQKGKFANAEKDEYPPAFALQTLVKDLGLISSWAKQLSLVLPSVAAAQSTAESAVKDHGKEDFSVVIRTVRESR